MKPSFLYKSNPIFINKRINCLEGHLENSLINFNYIDENKNDKIECKFYVYDIYDNGERSTEVFSVWFNDKPVMICQENGESNDFSDEFVTDYETYNKMIEYLTSLMEIPVEEKEEIQIYDPEVELSQLDVFCEVYQLSDYYIPETVFPKYKIDDIIIASVLEDHMRDQYVSKKIYIEERCIVKSISPHNPYETYTVRQLDRRWSYEDKKVIYDKGNGTIEAQINDEKIIRYA
jgi:hypothetical protein